MNIKQHKDGKFTAVSDNHNAIGEGFTFLEAMIECGEIAEEVAKRKAVQNEL